MIDFAHSEAHGFTPRTWRKPPLGVNGDLEPWKDDLAVVTCPNGHACRLSGKVHSIAPDGTLSPSLVCPAEGCGFHDHVRLAGWAP